MKLSNIIFGLVGAALGASISYVITKNVYQKRADEEIAAYKEYADNKIKDIESKDIVLSESEEKSIEELSKNVDKAVEEAAEIRKKYAKTTNVNDDYNGHMTVEEALETGDEKLIKAAEWLERKEEMEKEGIIKGQDGSPYVVSQLTYTGEGEGEYTYRDDYQKISLDWYAGDGVLAWGHDCDVDGELHRTGDKVDNPMFFVGYKWKQHFGDPDLFNDDDCVYVRNEYLGIDFEIVRDSGKYHEIVLKVFLDDENEEEKDESKEE